MSDILAMRGIILFFFPKCCSDIQFRCRHAHENFPFACMNPVLMKRSTRIVNWHSNILNDQPTDNSRYLQFLHNILCTSWYFLNEFCNIILTVEQFELCTTSLSKFYCNLLKI